ncbi:MAG TPA: Rieske 2Fe-2S domain-containing protein [Methylibium sp.]
MLETQASQGVALCTSADLAERGPAQVFDVLEYGRSVRAFALRFEGRVVAYLNRCAHVPTELDWQPGEFLDADREYIVCGTHGAVYDPRTGLCLAGPCARARLTPIAADEREGVVYWYPSRDIRPPAAPS